MDTTYGIANITQLCLRQEDDEHSPSEPEIPSDSEEEVDEPESSEEEESEESDSVEGEGAPVLTILSPGRSKSNAGHQHCGN